MDLGGFGWLAGLPASLSSQLLLICFCGQALRIESSFWRPRCATASDHLHGAPHVHLAAPRLDASIVSDLSRVPLGRLVLVVNRKFGVLVWPVHSGSEVIGNVFARFLEVWKASFPENAQMDWLCKCCCLTWGQASSTWDASNYVLE